MNDTKHPAIELADWLAGMVCVHPQRSEDDPGGYATEYDQKVDEAQVMLRRLAASEVALLEALEMAQRYVRHGGSESECEAVADLIARTRESCNG